MAQNKQFTVSIALTTTLTTNLLNPPTATGGTNGGSSSQYIILRNGHFVNKTGGAVTVSLWRGATGANAAGTEVLAQTLSIPAYTTIPWYGPIRLDAADFLVGGASANTAITFVAFGEIGVAG